MSNSPWQRPLPLPFQRVQERLSADFNPREQLARWFMNKNIENNDFPMYVLFTDEATRTIHMLQNENLHVVHQSPNDVSSCIRRQMCFQQDGAPAHTSRNVRQCIDHIYKTLWASPSNFYIFYKKSLFWVFIPTVKVCTLRFRTPCIYKYIYV